MSIRRFWLKRTKDETGISGSGRVLEGAIYPSGRVVIEWLSEHPSITVHDSFESFVAVHLSPHHASSNTVVWVDHDNVACECGHPLHWHLSGGENGKLEYCEGTAHNICDCTHMQPVAFESAVPRDVGYPGATTKAPLPERLREILRDRAL